MNKMTTEEAFVKVLQMHGIEHAFGIIGSAKMPISDLFPENGFKFWDYISSLQQEEIDDIEFKAKILGLIVSLLISSIFKVDRKIAWPEYVENLGGKPIRATNLAREPPLVYV